MTGCRRRSGFQLIDVVLAIGIMGMLASLILPALHKARESSSRLACQDHLKQIALAVHSHHEAWGRMPPYASGRNGDLFGGWFVHLMPFLGHEDLYAALRSSDFSSSKGVKLTGFSLWNPKLTDSIFPMLLCPSDPTWRATQTPATTNYLANWFAFGDGTGGAYTPPQRFRDLLDGLSNIVLFGEGYSICDSLPRLAMVPPHYHNFGVTQQGKASDDSFYEPDDYTMFQVKPDKCDKWRAQTPHEAMNIALADGTIRNVSANISSATWKNALKPRDGEVLGSDW